MTELRDVLEEIGVAVLFGAEGNDADRDPVCRGATQVLLVVTGLFRIGGIGEQDEMLDGRVGLLEFA